MSWRAATRAGNLAGYAHTTLLHAFLSHRRLRRNSEVPSESTGDVGSGVGGVGGGGGDTASSSPDHRLDLLAALRSLPPTDRAVVVLRYWEDRTALVRLRPHLTVPSTQEQP